VCDYVEGEDEAGPQLQRLEVHIALGTRLGGTRTV
jgi:hypothetical protein